MNLGSKDRLARVVGAIPLLNIVTEVAIHPELLRCRSASGAHVLEHAARRFSLRLA
jgi:hypothetical protein